LSIVTFIHLVIGEMAPKSWAIAHPERSATLLALPMRAFMVLFRPLVRGLNSAANALVRRFGVEPADRVATGQNPEDLRHLVEHSVSVGALDSAISDAIGGVLGLQVTRIGDLTRPDATLTLVPDRATAREVRAASVNTGNLRILVGRPESITGVIHVRDILTLPGDADATPHGRQVLHLDSDVTLLAALAIMRETRCHLAVVTGMGHSLGVVTLSDVLRHLLPRGRAL
jgi:CBS domain containing-hemolysin-like protein